MPRTPKKLTTTPAGVHVVTLFVPLEPHAKAVLDEGGHQTEATESGQYELGMSQKVLGHILCLRDQLVLIEVVHRANRCTSDGFYVNLV